MTMPPFEEWLRAKGVCTLAAIPVLVLRHWKAVYETEKELLAQRIDAEESRFEDVNLEIRAGAVVDEAFDLQGSCGTAAGLAIVAEEGDGKKLPTFSMTAYTGGPMNPGGWYRQEPIVVDLAGMRVPSQTLPIDHNHGPLVGHSTSIEKTPGETRLKVKGVLSAYSADKDEDDDTISAARQIVRMSKNNFPYQASIHAAVSRLEKFDAGEECKVNGQTFAGPLYVARASTLKGVAILADGADCNTQTKIAATRGSGSMDPVFLQWLKANDYSDADIAALTDKKRAPLLAQWELSKQPAPPIAQPIVAKSGDKSPEQLEEERIQARRRADAVEDERIASIRKICAKPEYAGLETVIDDPDNPGKDKNVSIASHAITAGWTSRATELECKRMARPGGGVGAFSHSHETDCTLETLQCAMLLRANPSAIGGGPQKDILAHPVYQTVMAAQRYIDPRGVEREMVPEFLRAGFTTDARKRALDNAQRFSEMSLLDLCAECIRLDGKPKPRGRAATIQAAFSGSSLNYVFTTNINTIMLATYAEAPDFSDGWTSSAEVNDFKTNERPRLTKGGPLSLHPRGGEADHAARSDTEETYKVQRYSRQFKVDEMDVIDDHFNALADIPVEMGNAGGRMRPTLVAAILLSNPSLNETGSALFGSGQGNLLTGNALSAAALQNAIATQAAFQENSVNIQLKTTHVIVPTNLMFTLRQLLQSSFIVAVATGVGNSAQTTTLGDKNTLEGVAEPRETAYLQNGVTDPSTATPTTYAGSTTNWYAASAQAHTVEVGYLKGTGRAPQMRSWMLIHGSWGIGYAINLDIGAKALDFKGLVKNTP